MLQLLSQLRLLACKNGGLNLEYEEKDFCSSPNSFCSFPTKLLKIPLRWLTHASVNSAWLNSH